MVEMVTAMLICKFVSIILQTRVGLLVILCSALNSSHWC